MLRDTCYQSSHLLSCRYIGLFGRRGDAQTWLPVCLAVLRLSVINLCVEAASVCTFVRCLRLRVVQQIYGYGQLDMRCRSLAVWRCPVAAYANERMNAESRQCLCVSLTCYLSVILPVRTFHVYALTVSRLAIAQQQQQHGSALAW